MSDLDEDTINWLSTMKIGDKLSYISDFENGYYMGMIFERLNLAKGRKFKNTNDMACKFQNFKNIRDLLYENFKVEFPIQNILFNVDALLKTIRECARKYNKDKKSETLRRIQTYSESKIQPLEKKMFASRQNEIIFNSKLSQTGKFPKKIEQIEQKLQKYREIKTKHELLALEDRKKEIEQNRRLIQQNRVFELNKVRSNHQFTKQHQRKVYDVCMKTQQTKKARIQKDSNLQNFLQQKKNKFYQSLREQEIRHLNQGLESFQMNCIRQGIQLQHDPDKHMIKVEENFNQQVVLERIKDNIKIQQKQRKERIKRENKKVVDAKEASHKAQQIWNENNLVQSYAKKMSQNLKTCSHLAKTFNRQMAEKKIIQQKSKNREYTELPQPIINEQQRNTEYRKRMMQYREEQIERLQRRQRKHRAIAENALDAIIQIVITNQDIYFNNKGFTYSQWKTIQKEFLSYQKKDKNTKDQSRYIDESNDEKAKEYINRVGQWSLKQEKAKQSYQVSQILQSLISNAYPFSESPQKSTIPLYMPLKIGLIGNHLSGKTTIAQKISNKYGIMIINPQTVINEAFELNKQQIVEDPKKKKDPKKPQQENPQKIALKQWGQKLMKRLDSTGNASIQHYIEAIEFKLTYLFKNKNKKQIQKQFQQAKIQETQRYNKSLKEFEQAQKKGKKDSKKGATEIEEPPTQRKYFYTKGFIIDGIDLSLDNIKLIQRKINGYISFEERVNQEGEEIKQNISNIIHIPKAIKDSKLQKGTFDLLIHLDSKKQTLEARKGSDKGETEQNDFKNIQHYYSDFGNDNNKLLAYLTVSNESTLQECVISISKAIQNHLNITYQQIQKYKSIQGESPDKQNINENQPNKIEATSISKEISLKLVNKFNEIFNNYLNNVKQSFTDYDQLRSEFAANILSIQQSFMNIINRPDDKAGKILNFQQNYNKLLSQKTSIVKDAQASKHLISKLDQINDNLWVSLQNKKNEAVTERQKVLAQNPLNNEIKKIVEITKKLFENELTLLVQIIFFIYNVNNALNGSNEEIPTEFLVLGIPPNLEPLRSFQDTNFTSERLDYYTNQTKACITQLPVWLKKKEKKFKIIKSELIDEILRDFLEKQIEIIYTRLEQIRQKTKEKYLEYYCFFKTLTNKMDDWIIQGIKYENEFVYDIYKTLKSNILQAKRSGVKDLFVKDVTQILHPISTLPPSRLPVVERTSQNNFKMLSFAMFMQQIKCLATGGRIPFKYFKSYIEKQKKAKWLQAEFLELELDIMQQYLVIDEYCNYKEVAMAMLLWKVKILQEDAITGYYQVLCSSKQKDEPQKYHYYKDQLEFQEFKIMPGITTDKEEERVLKAFIFQIFREEFGSKMIAKDYIDTLKVFCQLQVFKYGDTLMILHEAGDKHYEQKN